MKTAMLVFFCLWFLTGEVAASTLFTYQGQIQKDERLLNAEADLLFRLFDDEFGGNQVGPDEIHPGLPVVDGLFRANLDFGQVFDGTPLWLELTVDGITLPRQLVTAVPFATNVPLGAGSFWTKNGDDIFFSAGNVGIGTSAPTSSLSIVGSVVSGATSNRAGLFSAAIGGFDNEALSQQSVIIGGQGNVTSTNLEPSSFRSVIAGGVLNLIAAPDAFIGAGGANEIHGGGAGSAILGGGGHFIDARSSVIFGGDQNTVRGEGSFVGGGRDNVIDGSLSAVIGGFDNITQSQQSIVLGGQANTVLVDGESSSFRSVIAGGNVNSTTAPDSFIGGGGSNIISAPGAAIVGGGGNSVSGRASVVAGGEQNQSSGDESFVAAGRDNIAGGLNSTVLGGMRNEATGDRSVAGGYRAKALHDGSFVWADTTDADLLSTASNQVVFRASEGFRLYTNSEMNLGVELAPGGTSWTTLSDENAKTAISSIDRTAVLEQVLNLGISEYSYSNGNPSVRHVGPMAQTFHEAFGLGGDPLRISSMDLAGISIGAVQGLNIKLEASVEALRQENLELRAELAEIRALLLSFHSEIVELRETSEFEPSRVAHTDAGDTP